MGLEVPLWARGLLMGQGSALVGQEWSLVGGGEGQLWSGIT